MSLTNIKLSLEKHAMCNNFFFNLYHLFIVFLSQKRL